ncbi:hypothetical protein HDU96_010557 [Phlyctochytrium bullatum]|nr:hypothetical protein HDU96_010557 [Phlyctochytrium bullatum]
MPEIAIRKVAEILITVLIVAGAATMTPTGRPTILEGIEMLEAIAVVTVDVVGAVVVVANSKFWLYLRSYKPAKDSPQAVSTEIQISGSLIVVRLTT